MDKPPNQQPPLCEQAQYLQGQILALRALLLALADITADAPSFRASGLAALERLRTAMLSRPVAELQLDALDEKQAWLQELTRAGHGAP